METRRITCYQFGMAQAGTCRDEILAAFDSLRSRNDRDEFELTEVVREVMASGTSYSESTIRTEVVSRMCVNAPANHAVRHPDLERTSRGMYRRVMR